MSLHIVRNKQGEITGAYRNGYPCGTANWVDKDELWRIKHPWKNLLRMLALICLGQIIFWTYVIWRAK